MLFSKHVKPNSGKSGQWSHVPVPHRAHSIDVFDKVGSAAAGTEEHQPKVQHTTNMGGAGAPQVWLHKNSMT
ncbi:hypothetical protein [Sporisorium scitamineum]|uniref:Uncharacterized protein n=1 Tax=Sporisorium scitamineum TaxID=49012 RepID=A0A0F7RUU6_9BASI|nr:hypothetical protein [Sporisorium scitamineum]